MTEDNIQQDNNMREEAENQLNNTGGEKMDKEESGGINGTALLSYLFILFLVPLLAAKEDAFAQYHARQGFVLFIAAVLGMFVGVIPILGWILAPLISLACLVLAVIGLINVVKGEKKELPLIGQYAKKLNI